MRKIDSTLRPVAHERFGAARSWIRKLRITHAFPSFSAAWKGRRRRLLPPTNYLGSLAVPSGGASRRGLRHGGWRTNILPSIAALWINDVPDGTRTTLENFWRRWAPLLIKPRPKSPAEAGLKSPSMQKLRVNGVSSPLTLCRWWPAIADDVCA